MYVFVYAITYRSSLAPACLDALLYIHTEYPRILFWEPLGQEAITQTTIKSRAFIHCQTGPK